MRDGRIWVGRVGGRAGAAGFAPTEGKRCEVLDVHGLRQFDEIRVGHLGGHVAFLGLALGLARGLALGA